MSRASTFRQRDVEKALAAARKACGARFSLEIMPSGSIRIEAGVEPSAPAPVTDLDAWIEANRGRV